MQERKKNWVLTSYLQEEDKIRHRVLLSYESLNSRKQWTFYTMSYLQGPWTYGKAKEAVESAKAGLTLLRRAWESWEEKRKRPRKARRLLQQRQHSVCPKPRIHFFGSRVLGFWKTNLDWSIASCVFFTMKPCAKEVPETDYSMQQKQYLKRTTLCRLKIPLRSICSEEGPHYRLSKAWARKLSSDKQQSTFIHKLEILFLIPYLGYTA